MADPAGMYANSYLSRSGLRNVTFNQFEGAPCAGGASYTKPEDGNFAIIENGNNRYDANTYRVRGTRTDPGRFVWGHDVTDWDGFRRLGQEWTGRILEF